MNQKKKDREMTEEEVWALAHQALDSEPETTATDSYPEEVGAGELLRVEVVATSEAPKQGPSRKTKLDAIHELLSHTYNGPNTQVTITSAKETEDGNVVVEGLVATNPNNAPGRRFGRIFHKNDFAEAVRKVSPPEAERGIIVAGSNPQVIRMAKSKQPKPITPLVQVFEHVESVPSILPMRQKQRR